MSAKDVKAATRGPVIGGICYLLFAFVPMFLVVEALVIMPEQTAELLRGDTQKIRPMLMLEKMPLFAQVNFFGAMLFCDQINGVSDPPCAQREVC